MSKASAFSMDALDNRIKELVAYARTRDGEDRSTLFRNLIDLFLTGKAPSANHTRNQLLDVIEALIPHVDAEARRTAADLLSNMSTPPTDLAIRLCRDRASLVGNLLKCAPFDEDDILDLIGKTGREHHQILASREDLSANVWIALARAAPSAPPFDHQSTLALWSDDLGILQINETPDSPRPQATNVTPLHIDKNKTAKGSIRIIKTGDDLIAERSETTQFEEKNTNTVEHKTTELKQAVTPTPVQNKPQHSNTAKNTQPLNNPELNQFLTDDDFAHTPLKDPGPGGWAWHTDRDGLVISLSPKAIELLGDTNGVIGASVLDMLGLNTKIGHPVARAFQRRSTIHDAPITLQSLDKPFQHWTLEATPVFSSCGGIFEGYEGILTPVVPSNKSDSIIPSDDEANAMFLDDITPAQKTNTSPKFNRIEPVRQPDYTPKPDNTNADTGVDSIVGQATATAVKEILNEALGPLTGSTEPKETESAQTIEQKVETASKDVQKTNATLSASQVLATLDLLDEALKRLTEAAQHAPDPSVRLQGEIAAACSRSLREQLSGK